jgi:acyl dehydratase
MAAHSITLNELKQQVGQEVGISDWLQVTQDMINRFAGVTDDHQWIHIDVERAEKESQFGTTIAHGFLTLSLLSHMLHQAVYVKGDFGMTINYGLNRVRFVSPLLAGSRIRGRFIPQEVGDNQVIWKITVEGEGLEKPILAAEWIVRFIPQGTA